MPALEPGPVLATACLAEHEPEDPTAPPSTSETNLVDWHLLEHTGLRKAQEDRLPLFERTRSFRSYSPGLIPGLLQTHAYTEDVLRAVQRRRVAVDDVADAVAARMERQHVLHQGGRQFAFLVEEPVLRNALGGRDAQLEQLDRLLSIESLPHITLGVLPVRLSRARMPVEGFWIFDDAQVNVELVSGYLTLTQPGDVTAYAASFADLTESAVHGAEAQALIGAAMNALG
ncbi:DUF5753 domain-containing protein [Streptomyces sp. NPDC048290]|uniref:DUF5753 domain-containing protein n=1 Tax=Streptomyces sp. NPDC048290 TaxID=3155811 RepID=UPI00344743E4